VLIVGAGPAGLAAAVEASRAGADTCVVDLRPALGGRTPRSALTRRLVRDVLATGVEVRLDTAAWGIWGRTLAICRSEGRDHRVQAECIVLATGARARPIVFPGWRLPGVTTGSDCSGRVVVAGSGPGLASQAVALHRRGVDVRAVVEASKSVWHSADVDYLRRHKVAMRNGHLVVRAEGAERVERAVVARVDEHWRVLPRTEFALEVDTIVLEYGEVPCAELSRLSGCAHIRSGLDSLVPLNDEWMRTDAPGLLVAGDVRGVCGPGVAAEQGRLAGIAVALELGRLTVVEAERLARPVRTRLRRLTVEREREWSAYCPGCGMFELAQPETVVCHCENVTAAAIQAAILDRSPDPAPVRGETRAGMGLCQARDCGRQIEALVAQAAGVPLGAVPPLSVRPPVIPIPLGAIARGPDELV
jgi:thioredoxin reductase